MNTKMSKRQQYDTLRQQAFDMGLPKKGFGKKPISFYQDIISKKATMPQQTVKLTKTGKIRKPSKPISNERKEAIKQALGQYNELRNKASDYGLLKAGEGKKSKEFYKNLVDEFESKLITKKVFNGSVVDATIECNGERDLYVIEKKYTPLIKLFINRIIKNNNLNFQITVHTQLSSLKLAKEDEEKRIYEHYFTTESIKLIKGQYDLIENTILNTFNEIRVKIEEFCQRGSEWVLDKIFSIYLKSTKFKSVMGSSFFEYPAIKGKKAFLNIQNEDDKCFLWCLTAYFHPTTDKHSFRTSCYKDYINMWNIKNIEFPMKVHDINKFVKQNTEQLCGKGINIFTLDSKKTDLDIIKLDNDPYNAIDLLLIENEGQTHYVLIKDINSFGSVDKKNKTYMCKRCLAYRTRNEELLKEHDELCRNSESTRVVLPIKGLNDILKFTGYKNMLPVDFIIVYDFEAHFQTLQSIDNADLTSEKSTQKINKHVPNSCLLQTICFTDSKYNREKLIYNFENSEKVVEDIVEYLFEEEERISCVKANIVPMKLTKEEEILFENSKICHICNEPIPKFIPGKTPQSQWAARDHCHITGKFRGAAHNGCNLNYKKSQFIPVIAHNSKNYDSHFLIKEFGKKLPLGYELKCIPNNEEKYISFSIKTRKTEKEGYIFHELRFLDSYSFLAGTLDSLGQGLEEEDFVFLKNSFPDQKQFELAKRKGYYPYEYMDDNISKKMEETCLPPIEAFNSKLYGGQISNRERFVEEMSEKEYKEAINAWEVFQCKTLLDYHLMYLRIDVMLLCDIIQKFRKLGLSAYKLDPMNYYTLPGYSWDALLFQSKVELELLTDMDMVNMVESGTRGGISTIKHRYAKSKGKNKSLKNMKADNILEYLRYWDANNLYGWAMSQYLPHSNFEWCDEAEFDTQKILNISDEADTGYIFMVDIEVPKDHNKQDFLKDYPLLPEHLIVKNNMLSEYQLSFNNKEETVKKLCLTLQDKEKYVIHYRNLKQAIDMGYKITKIHKVLKFTQKPWMKPYIELNTNFRKQAKTDFEKDFYKLMNNSVFGKTMENIRNRIEFTLINNEEKLLRYTNQIRYKTHVVFDYDEEETNGLIGVHMHKTKVVMNKPIYVGMAVLDLSKVLMYNFHYNFIKKNFGNNATLLFTDTDSLCYSIRSTEEHFYKCQKENLDLFDNSAYPKDHPLYNTNNKKVIGKFKDECNALEMDEFVGLRAKLYSFTICEDEYNKHKLIEPDTTLKQFNAKAKGVKKCVTNRLKLNDYKDCLMNRNPLNVKVRTFKSSLHNIYTIESTKLALSPFDNKNYILPDGISTLPFGHYLTN